MSSAGLQQNATITSDQHRALFAVSDAIASHRDLSVLFHELGNRLSRVVNFDALSLVLHDLATNVMRLHVIELSEPLATPFTLERVMHFANDAAIHCVNGKEALSQ